MATRGAGFCPAPLFWLFPPLRGATCYTGRRSVSTTGRVCRRRFVRLASPIRAAPSLVGTADVRDPALPGTLPWIALTTYYRERVTLLAADGGPALQVDIQPRLLTDNLFVVRQAALAGLGAAVVSAWLVSDELRTGRLLRLLPEREAPPLPVNLVYPSARQIPSRLRAFIDAMKACLPHTHGMRIPPPPPR